MANFWEQDEVVGDPWDADEVVGATPAKKAAPAKAAAAGKRINLGEFFFPATTEHAQKNGNDPSLGRYGSMAMDVVTMPWRLGKANMRIGDAQDGSAGTWGGDPDKVIEAATQTKPDGVIDAIGREAPLMLLPGGQVRGVGIAQRIMSGAGRGAAEAIPSAALHQTTAEDGSVKEGLKEVATGGILRGGTEGAGRIVDAAVPYLKRGVSKISEVSQDALEAVTKPFGGKANLKQASAAAKRFGTAEGGTDLTPMAEELGQRVDRENAVRTANVERARRAQRIEMEGDVLSLRSDRPVKRIQQVSAGDQGNQITGAIEGAKGPMQDAWQQGDVGALGSLREAPVASRTAKRIEEGFEERTIGAVDDRRKVKVPFSREVAEEVPVLPGNIDGILSGYKALSPEQGIAKLTPAAEGAIKHIANLAQERGKTIDDLINLKGQLRSMTTAGNFKGAAFDVTTDDRAFGEVSSAIDQAIEESIYKAVPDKGAAAGIISAFRANQVKYARLKEALGDLSRKFGQIQNNANIITRIEEMGPKKAVDLIQEAASNAPLKPVVDELRRGFVDDMLLSAVKDGEFSPSHFARGWKNLDADVKKAWLTSDQIKAIEKAVKKGTEEIEDPQLVGKALFGKAGSEEGKHLAGQKLGNITSAAQKKALAELQSLDALFGTEYTQEAIAAYRAKQLQMGERGTLPIVGNTRTGKFATMASTLGGGTGTGAIAGGVLAGPVGAGVGSLVGLGAGFFSQSPAGAVFIFRALNRLEQTTVSDAAKRATSQALRSAAFQPKAKRIE